MAGVVIGVSLLATVVAYRNLHPLQERDRVVDVAAGEYPNGAARPIQLALYLSICLTN